MAEEFVPFGSAAYWCFLAVLLFARGMDFLSTYIASPTLMLEGNPIAKWMGWKKGIFVNVSICFLFALSPLASVIIATCSLMVAARNFSQACLMRALGELDYQCWYAERMMHVSHSLFLVCLLGQTVLVALVGLALVLLGRDLLSLGIGVGLIAYSLALLVFSLIGRYKSLPFRN